MENVLFIINPISEERKGLDLKRIIKGNLDLTKFSYTIKYSEYSGQAYELAHTFRKDFHIIIAVGGDGTVNQVSNALEGSDKLFGIVPLGSGNGLARALKIPMKASKAIRRINLQNVKQIDTGEINGKYFVNMAGIGFDAEVAHDFANSSQRGFITYLFMVIRKFYRYSPIMFTIVSDDDEHYTEAFLVSFANSSQYGNNAHISPHAKLDDGLLDVCFMRGFSIWAAPFLAYRLFTKNMDKSNYLKIIQLDKLKLKSDNESLGHIDGEPFVFEKEVEVRINKKSLNVIV